MTKREQVIRRLRDLATTYQQDPHGWGYKSNLGEITVKDIVYTDETNRNSLTTKFRKVTYWLFNAKTLRELGDDSLWNRISMAVFSLKRQVNRPDGTLNNGTIIAVWQEDGLLIEMLQPSVAVLIADFLEKDPTNIHAKRIVAEMDRIVNTPWKKTK